MTEEEKTTFVRKGRDALTALAFAARVLIEWSETYTQRGGQATFGDDAAAIAQLGDQLNNRQGFMSDARRALIARLRTDI